MNDIKALLPIGSIVLMEGGQKKLMVYGVKQTDLTDDTTYDYIGVVYPEGSMGEGTQFFFNHEDIAEVIFKGYEDTEREDFIERLDQYYKQNS